MNRLCGLRVSTLRSLKISSNNLIRNQSGKSTMLTSEKKKLKVAEKFKIRTYINYGLALMFTFWGLAFWAVPFYRVFCESDGKSWTEALTGVRANHDTTKVSSMEPDYDRPMVVRFLSTVDEDLAWEFTPCQDRIVVHPGETALAFYTATNKTQHPIVGVSTYTIEPYIVGPHFNKIQCFCFEEQILYPGETVDMPVFFFIDPDISEDPDNIGTSNITLAYNFHKVSMENMPALPGFENIQLQKSESLIKL